MIIMMEGFDHYDVSATSTNRLYLKGWRGSAFGLGQGRFPWGEQSSSIEVIFANPVMKPMPNPVSDLVVGFAFRIDRLMGTGMFQLISQDWSDTITIGITHTGQLYIIDSSGNQTTGTHSLSPDTWYYVELKLNGTAELHLNGYITEIGPVSGSWSSDWNMVRFTIGLLLGGNSFHFDDFYMCDLTGGINNDFLGDVVVETLYPIADGTYTQWTPDTGTTHYTRVNELKIDENTSYVHTTTAGNKDSYPMGAPVLLHPTPVYGTQLNLGLLKADAGTRTVAPLIRQGGTDYIGSAVSIPSDWEFVSTIYNTDPTGADWTDVQVNGDEFGIELVS